MATFIMLHEFTDQLELADFMQPADYLVNVDKIMTIEADWTTSEPKIRYSLVWIENETQPIEVAETLEQIDRMICLVNGQPTRKYFRSQEQ